jgi:putative ABC transport system permease protein
LEPTGIGIDDGGFVTLDTVYNMAKQSEATAVRKLDVQPGQVSAIMVNLEPNASRGEVAKKIETEIPGVAVVTSRELMSSSVARQLESLTPGLLLIGAGFWLISVLMVGALFSMIVNERRRELGLLQAMGATPSFIFRLVMLEAVELTTIGGIAGLAAGGVVILVLMSAISSSLGIAYLWPGAYFIVSFALGYLIMALITGVIAALYPAVVASRLEPYQAIRTGE